MTRWKSLSGKLWVTAICSDTKLHEIFRLSFCRESFLSSYTELFVGNAELFPEAAVDVTNSHSAERFVLYEMSKNEPRSWSLERASPRVLISIRVTGSEYNQSYDVEYDFLVVLTKDCASPLSEESSVV